MMTVTDIMTACIDPGVVHVTLCGETGTCATTVNSIDVNGTTAASSGEKKSPDVTIPIRAQLVSSPV
jgi:hypothetical protein